MSTSEAKILQYLNEAQATELGARPRPAVADRHDPARQLPRRPGEATSARPATTPSASAGAARGARPRRQPAARPPSASSRRSIGQALALGKTPLDLLRGSGGEEKVLKNAKDACATEALEIATYTAIERLARAVDDDADRASWRRRSAPTRSACSRACCARSRSSPTPSWAPRSRASRPTTSRRPARPMPPARDDAAAPRSATKRAARQARKVPGVARAEGAGQGRRRLRRRTSPIARYDDLTAEEIIGAAGRALAGRPGQGRRLRAQATRTAPPS